MDKLDIGSDEAKDLGRRAHGKDQAEKVMERIQKGIAPKEAPKEAQKEAPKKEPTYGQCTSVSEMRLTMTRLATW